jgi:hypothetical protein
VDTRAFNRSVIEEFRANGGVLGGQLAGKPMLLLTTTGRRSGQARTTPLLLGFVVHEQTIGGPPRRRDGPTAERRFAGGRGAPSTGAACKSRPAAACRRLEYAREDHEAARPRQRFRTVGVFDAEPDLGKRAKAIARDELGGSSKTA